MQRMAGELITNLKDLSVPVPDKASYAELLDLAKRTRRKNDQLVKTRQGRESEIAGYERQIDDSIQRKDDAKRNMDAWSLQWTQIVGKLGFDANTKPEEVNDFVLALDQVFGELEKAEEKQQRIAGMQSNYEKYATRINDLLDKLAPDLMSAEPTAAIVELHDRLTADQAQHKERKQLEEQLKKKRTDLSRIRENLAAEREKLRLLCVDAQTNTPDDLPEIEKRAASKSKLLANLEAANERLAELASGQELTTFVVDVQAHDPDELIAKLGRLDEEKKDCIRNKNNWSKTSLCKKESWRPSAGNHLQPALPKRPMGLPAKFRRMSNTISN